MTEQEPAFGQLADLDPVRADPAPPHGSTRHDATWERSMQLATTRPPDAPNDGGTDDRPSPWRRRRTVVAAAVLAVAAGLLAVVVLRPGEQALDPRLEVRAAAAELAAADTLRATLERFDESGRLTEATSGEFADGDARIVVTRPEQGEVQFVYRDDTLWTTAEGHTTEEDVTGTERPAPFAQASEAVLHAATTGGSVAEEDQTTLDGEAVLRYRIEPDAETVAALRALQAGELAWFELEDPAAVERLDVWVADGRIRQVEVVLTVDEGQGPQRETLRSTYTDLGADISVEAPPG